MRKEKDYVGMEPVAEGILLVWGLEPTKQNLAKVSLPPWSHTEKAGEEKLRWSLVEGFVSLMGVDLKTLSPRVTNRPGLGFSLVSIGTG